MLLHSRCVSNADAKYPGITNARPGFALALLLCLAASMGCGPKVSAVHAANAMQSVAACVPFELRSSLDTTAVDLDDWREMLAWSRAEWLCVDGQRDLLLVGWALPSRDAHGPAAGSDGDEGFRFFAEPSSSDCADESAPQLVEAREGHASSRQSEGFAASARSVPESEPIPDEADACPISAEDWAELEEAANRDCTDAQRTFLELAQSLGGESSRGAAGSPGDVHSAQGAAVFRTLRLAEGVCPSSFLELRLEQHDAGVGSRVLWVALDRGNSTPRIFEVDLEAWTVLEWTSESSTPFDEEGR